MPSAPVTYILIKNGSTYIADSKERLAALSEVKLFWVNNSLLRRDGYLYDSAGNKIGRLLKIDGNADVDWLAEEGMSLLEELWSKVESEAVHKKLQLTNDLRTLIRTIKGAPVTTSDLTDVLVKHDIVSIELVRECLKEIGYKEQVPPRGGTKLNSSQLAFGARHMANVNTRLTFGGGPFLQPHYETDQNKILGSLLDTTSNNVPSLMNRITSALSDAQARIRQMNIDALVPSNISDRIGEKKNGDVEVEESGDDEEAASKNGGPTTEGGGNGGENTKEIEAKTEQIEKIQGDIILLLGGRNEDDLSQQYNQWHSLQKQIKRTQGGKKAELDVVTQNGLREDMNRYQRLKRLREKLEQFQVELAALRGPSVDTKVLKKRLEVIKQINDHEKVIDELLKGTTEEALHAASKEFKTWHGNKKKAEKANKAPPAEPPLLREQMNAFAKLKHRRRKLADVRDQLKVLDDGLATKPPPSFSVTPVSSGGRKSNSSISTAQVAEPAQDDIGDSKPAKKRARRKKAATDDQVMQSARPTLPLPALPLDHAIPPLTLVDPSWSMEGDDTPVDTDAPTNTAFV